MAKTGREIIIGVCERYANLKTYQDFGVIRMREKVGEPGEAARIIRFYTYFEQPDFFRCEWYETASNGNSAGYCDSRLTWMEKLSGIISGGKKNIDFLSEAKFNAAFKIGLSKIGQHGPAAIIKSSLKAPSVAPVLEPFGQARFIGKTVHNKEKCDRLLIEIDESYYGEFLVSQRGSILIRSKEAVCSGSKSAASTSYGGVLLNGKIPYERFKSCKLPRVTI
ncbi:hypothetical protein BH11CYA1_BH11CYA1_31200 [soil metagenome]